MTAKECLVRAERDSVTLGALSLAIESESGGSMANSLERLSSMLEVMEAEVENALTAPVLSETVISMKNTGRQVVHCSARFRRLPLLTHYLPLKQTPRWAELSHVRLPVHAVSSRHVYWLFPGYGISRGKRYWKHSPVQDWSEC